MLLNKRNKEESNISGEVDGVEFNEGYKDSGYSSGDISSGMSGGFSADSRETYEAAKVAPANLRMRGLTGGMDREIGNVMEDISGEPGVALEIRKLDAKINSIIEWIKSFYSNFSRVIEEINTISERLDENKMKSENVLNDVEDLKKRAEVFIGTEELLKLNDEIKSNLDKIINSSGVIEGGKRDIPIDLLEKTAILSKHNNEALGAFTFKDYEEKIDSILKVIENLAEQISGLNKKLDSCEERLNGSESGIKKSEIKKKEKRKSEESYEEFLENLGEMPELPELPSQRTKRTSKLKKNK